MNKETIDIVVSISEEVYEYIKNLPEDRTDFKTTQLLYKAIRDGLSLGYHGNLVDENDVVNIILFSGLFDNARCGDVKDQLSKLQPIIQSNMEV